MNDFLNYMLNKLNKDSIISPKSIAWNICPKINAVFRAGTKQDKECLFKGFVSEEDKDVALKTALKCHRKQSEVVKNFLENEKKDLHFYKNCVIIYIDNNMKEYSGLLASKFADKYKKPAFVIRETNKDFFSGSCRSSFPLKTLINNTNLAIAQGHESAFGIQIYKNNFECFVDWIESQDFSLTQNNIEVTAVLSPQQITLPLCMACEEHNDIWGHGVVEPTFYVKFTCYQNWVRLFRKKTTTGKISAYGVDFIKFRLSEEQSAEWEKYDKFTFEAIVTLCTNEWNGRYYPQAMIQQYEITPKSKVRSLADDDDWRDLF